MTYLKILLFLVVITAPLVAELHWNYDYKKALHKATKSQKQLFVYFSAHWCRYCKIMSNTTFKDKEVQRALRKFICVKINYDKKPHLVALFKVSGIPIYFIANPQGKTLARLNGYIDTPAFLAWLKQKQKKILEKKIPQKDLALIKKQLQDVKKRPKALESLLKIIIAKRGEDTSALEKPILEIGQKDYRALLPYLNHKRLAVRILIGNILHKLLGKAFVFDPWEKEAIRKKTIQQWQAIK